MIEYIICKGENGLGWPIAVKFFRSRSQALRWILEHGRQGYYIEEINYG